MADVTFGKIISLGSRRAPRFELSYGRHQHLTPAIDDALPPTEAIQQIARLIARRRIKSILRRQLRPDPEICVVDTVTFRRDCSGRLFPSRVAKYAPHYYDVVHNGCS